MAYSILGKATGKMQIFLKEWRSFRGLSQKELAVRSGRSSQTISNIEHGRAFTEKTMMALADALNCTPDELAFPPETIPISLAPAVKQGTAIELKGLGEILIEVSSLMTEFPERVQKAVLAAERSSRLLRN